MHKVRWNHSFFTWLFHYIIDSLPRRGSFLQTVSKTCAIVLPPLSTAPFLVWGCTTPIMGTDEENEVMHETNMMIQPQYLNRNNHNITLTYPVHILITNNSCCPLDSFTLLNIYGKTLCCLICSATINLHATHIKGLLWHLNSVWFRNNSRRLNVCR